MSSRSRNNPGVYFILIPKTQRTFVGSSKNLAVMEVGVRSLLRRGMHNCKQLQADYNLHQELEFSFMRTTTREQAYDLAQSIMDNTKPLLYNRAINSRHSQKGLIIEEEICQKLSQAHKNKIFTEETRLKMSAAKKGRALTEAQLAMRLVRSKKKISNKPISVVIDNVPFDSMVQAAKALKINSTTVSNRIKSDNPKFSNWVIKSL